MLDEQGLGAPANSLLNETSGHSASPLPTWALSPEHPSIYPSGDTGTLSSITASPATPTPEPHVPMCRPPA